MTFRRLVMNFFMQLMKARSYLYARGILRSHAASIPVISIGNISVGGTGKTPLCIFLAKALKERGYSPVVLSRGYRGNYRGVHLVAESDSAELTGDEPLLIAQSAKCPVVLSRKRANGALFITENKLGNLIILDDGLQHLALRRDVDIVLINVSSKKLLNDFLENRALPFGTLREDPQAALKRADIVVLSNRLPQTKAAAINREILKAIPASKVIVTSYFEPRGVFSREGDERLAAPAKVVAFSGVANPEAFHATLESLGFEISAKCVKPDHYLFSEGDLTDLKKEYQSLPLVCTEKDATRIPVHITGIYILKGEAKVSPEDAFLVKILKKLNSANMR